MDASTAVSPWALLCSVAVCSLALCSVLLCSLSPVSLATFEGGVVGDGPPVDTPSHRPNRDPSREWPGTESRWHEFKRHDFTVDGRKAFVVIPNLVAPGRPWVWRARFPGFHTAADRHLLARGFHVAFIDTDGMFGSTRAMDHWAAFYRFMVDRGLADRVALEGVSRGGLFVYAFASRWPTRVACIYADTPVCDIKSWPGGHGTGRGHAESWQSCLTELGITEAEAATYRGNPIDTLATIAAAKIPLFHVISMNDVIVPPAENTLILAERYRALGGTIDVLRVPKGTERSNGHHFEHPDPLRVADFIERHASVLPKRADYFISRSSGAPGSSGSAPALQNSRIKFEREGVGRVAFLGGSITQNPGWRDATMRYLEERFPQTTFDFVSAGLASTGSTPGAFRLSRDVLSRGPVDLLFEEAAVNDLTNGRNPLEVTRGMEGILRRARRANPQMDLVVMHFVAPPNFVDYHAGRTPPVIENHETVAAHYGATSIHFAREVSERIDARQFTWEKDFRGVHPSKYGQALCASTIRRALSHAWSQPIETTAKQEPHPWPPRLDRFSYDSARFAAVQSATVLDGFALADACDPRLEGVGGGVRDGFVNVPMLVGTAPGDSFRYDFAGRAIGLFVAAGPDAGVIEYRVDDGAWKSRDLFTPWSRGLHLPWAHILEAELTPLPHSLFVRISATKNERSRGTACRIVHVLVNE